MNTKKTKKTRSKKYDDKLAINGSFEDVIKVSVTPAKTVEKQPNPVGKVKKKS